MKPSKAENEVGSTVKATSKYSFLAPGTIGKGRGRGQGLRSLCSLGVLGDEVRSFHQSGGQGMRAANKKPLVLEKKHMQTDMPMPQSTDLIMKYLQTTETSAIGKGHKRGLRSMCSLGVSEDEEGSFYQSSLYASQSMTTPPNSTRSDSTKSVGQGMRITHKNPLVLEKEHIPVHPSVDSFMQYNQAFETSAMGKERGSGHRSFCSSGASENEVANLRKSALSTGQGKPTVTKNPLVLEKDHMQSDIPLRPFTDQVTQSTQTAEKSSCTTGKIKNVRGRNKCKEVASLEVGQKLEISFYNNRTVGPNHKSFSRHLGKIVRDTNMCPLGVSSWKDIKEEKLNHMWAAVEDKFESDELDIHRDHIFQWMQTLWNKWRGYLHANYVRGKSIQEALRTVPKGVDKKQWEWLVKEHFLKESFKARSSRNTVNRSKLKMLHHCGSKPIREIIYQKGGKDGNPPDLATIFFETRKKNGTLVESEAIEKHAQIQKLVHSEPSLPTIEIVEKCFGIQNRSHVVGFGGGVRAKDLKGGSSSKTELLSKLRSTQEENRCLKDRLSKVENQVENQVKEMAQLRELILSQHLNVQPPATHISGE